MVFELGSIDGSLATGLKQAPQHVLVASTSVAKHQAVTIAFTKAFPHCVTQIVPSEMFFSSGGSINISNVPEQPVGDAQTRQGAVSRVTNARTQPHDRTAYSYLVGIEGGVETIEGNMFCFAWVAILETGSQKIGLARSGSFVVPPQVATLVNEGVELGHACDQVYQTDQGKLVGGLVGIVTCGLVSRAQLYSEAVVLALSPFLQADADMCSLPTV